MSKGTGQNAVRSGRPKVDRKRVLWANRPWKWAFKGLSATGFGPRTMAGHDSVIRKHAKDRLVAVTWEETDLQTDLTMGNLASTFTIQSDEAALVEELRAGSEDAFAWLITRYHQPIYSLLARTVRNSADAADLTQEVFVKVFRGIHGFHGESSLRTWIYRIALREASNRRRWWIRHQQQEIAIEQDLMQGDGGKPVQLKDMLVDPAESPYEVALHEENRKRVEHALRQVPEPFRTTLILRDIEGFVYEEVAAIQGVNLGTVKSRLVRGRACLKSLLTAARPVSQHTALPGMKMSLGEETR